jgi:bacterioferritin
LRSGPASGFLSRMKGSPRVIDLLNEVLTAELTAINEYFIHARMCENWGFERLWRKLHAESIEEMKHADMLIKRILFLEGVPNLQRLGKVNVGEDVPEQLALDRKIEERSVETLTAGIQLCVAENDQVSRVLLEKILADSEAHLDWIETQQGLIERIGLANYLAQQLRPDAG